MYRMMIAVLVAMGCAPLPGNAQEKKTIVDPAEAGIEAKLQGEYVGSYRDELELALGAQVIALGNGQYQLHFYPGGLPGAGWSGSNKLSTKGKLQGDKIVFGGEPDDGTGYSGEIADGQLRASTDAGGKATLKRTERKSPTLGAKPPEGAVILFDGSTAEKWINGKLVEVGGEKYLDVGVKSRPKFDDFTLHLEFRLPFMPSARGQGRANSGCYLQHRYECQILDSFGLEGLDNECGGFYKQYRPNVNMCLPPLAWQTYDIDFTAAKYDNSRNKTAPARATVKHNGVVIHDDVVLKTATPGGIEEGPEPAPIFLQNHGNPIVFRNIWVVAKDVERN